MQKYYDELAFFTLNLNYECFVHQYVVDAFTTRYADNRTKQISLAFALVGLYLFVEKGYSGREVQRFHVLMSKNKIEWPSFMLPSYSVEIVNLSTVLASKSDKDRIKMIEKWCVDVWNANMDNHKKVKDLVEYYVHKKPN